MALRLPPLNALRLFEAAARRLSFKQAADELHVTPSAVSHGIQSLEDWLGTALFQRGARGLSLTLAGETYYPAIRDALNGIAHATDTLPGRKATGALSISVAPTFGAKWLVPRLARFRDRHPDISVVIDTAHRQVEFPLDQIDLAIRMGTQARAGATWFPLLRESFLPVCSPHVKEALAGKGTAEILRDTPIIHVTTAGEEWDAWLEAAAVARAPRKDDLRFDTVQMATEAALQGLGIALGRKPLVNAELESGAIVAAIDFECRAKTLYWLVGAAVTFERPEVKVFKNWILEEVKLLQNDDAVGY